MMLSQRNHLQVIRQQSVSCLNRVMRFGKDEMLAYQASARGGVVWVRVVGDRVYLGGQAVTVLRGELVDF